MRCIRQLLVFCAVISLAACGGGGGGGSTSVTVTPTPSGSNVQAITVSGGPNGNVNLPLISVVVCVPGSSNCVTLNNILVDTGSNGLRVLASTLTALTLPQQASLTGNPLLECVQFVDSSHVWGPVKIADIKIGGETASSIPMQLIGSPTGIAEPAACGTATDNLDTVAKLGANGVLGIGHFVEDCGTACSLVANNQLYYSCPSTGCVSTTATLTSQVQNPVAQFPTDNNGVIIQLPSVAAAGVASLDGWLIFGIGTQSNNTLGSATIYTVSNIGQISTAYKGTTYSGSFVDSGSNGLYFPDSTIPNCASAPDFYCPTSTLNLSGTLIGANNASKAISFSVANAESFAASINVVGNLAGAYANGFDWGLPFFFGRKVYTAIETNSGGPYVAF